MISVGPELFITDVILGVSSAGTEGGSTLWLYSVISLLFLSGEDTLM